MKNIKIMIKQFIEEEKCYKCKINPVDKEIPICEKCWKEENLRGQSCKVENDLIPLSKVLEMIGEDRTYPEYEQHKHDVCICTSCNRTWGINREKQNLRNALEDYKKLNNK